MRRWDPLQDLLSLQERMNRLFEQSLARLDQPVLPTGAWTPPSDVIETRDGFVVQVELPGIPREQIEIRAEPETLVVRGERRLEGQARPESFHRMERSYGPFSRTFHLPTEVDPTGLVTELQDGLLRVEIPKAATAPRRPAKSRR
jgi:HSP20 family protein